MSPCITPLHLSSCRGTEEDVRQLDEVIRVDPQALHRLQHSLSFEFAMPLMCAAEAGHPTCLKKLLERGADLLATDRERRYAIFYAVSTVCMSTVLHT
jgi:ankyrin repeat protein